MGGFNKLGAVGGLFVRRDISERLSWQFEMLYSGKGSKQVIDPILGPNPYRGWNNLRLHYIEVPVFLNYKILHKIALQGGLGAAYLFSSKFEPKGGSIQKAEFLRKYEISITGGGTYQLSPKIAIFARYTNSLSSIGETVQNQLRPLNYIGRKISLVASFGLNYHFIPEQDNIKKPKFLERNFQ